MINSIKDAKFDFVTSYAKSYENGLFINFDQVRLAIIEKSIFRWNKIAASIDYEMNWWIKDSPKNRRYDSRVEELKENLQNAVNIYSVELALNDYLQTFLDAEWDRQHLNGQNIVLNVLTEQQAALFPWVMDHNGHWLNAKTKMIKAGSNFTNRIVLELHPNKWGERRPVSGGEFSRYNACQARLLRTTNCRHFSEVSQGFCRDFLEFATSNALGKTERTREHFKTTTANLMTDLAGPPNDYSKDWRAFITRGQRKSAIGDESAWWVVDPEIGHPSFTKWQAIFSAYLESSVRTGTTGVSKARYLREGLLGWLRTFGEVLADPDTLTVADYIQTGGENNLSGGLTFEEFIIRQNDEQMTRGEGGLVALGRTAAAPGQMFEYIVTHRPHLFSHARNLVPSRLSQYPTVTTSNGERPSKTQKLVLPAKILEMALEILTEDNSAWPKMQNACIIQIYDPQLKQLVKEFFPGPAVLLETLLSLPLRGLQARYLDSGEFDEFFVDEKGQRVRNDNPIAIPGRQSGFCQLMNTPLGEHPFSGFRISTNKTNIKQSPGLEIPYDIPWNKQDLLRRMCALRDWQMRLNPAEKLVKRCELPADKTPDGKLASKFVFLFRDAGRRKTAKTLEDVRTLAPISHSKTSDLFNKLLLEVETRIGKKQNGRQINLVEIDSAGHLSSRFSIHSLRASLITHLIDAGLPVHIVSEFVVGHANLIMTLYYNKTSPATISDLLNDAAAKLEHLETDPYLEGLNVGSENRFRDEFVLPENHNSAFQEMEPGLWHTRIDGICPVACTRCFEGAVVKDVDTKEAKKVTYAAVNRNEFSCGRCRFNLTGPMFLSGQIIVHTNLVYTLREKGKVRSKLIEKQSTLTASGNNIRAAQNAKAIGKLSDELDELMIDLSFRTQRISQSIVLMKRGDDNLRKNTLITGLEENDLDAVFVETSEDALTAMVSEIQFFYPETSQGSASPRHRLIMQKVLSENGFGDFLIKLPDEVQHEVSVRLTQFLRRSVGDSGIGDLFSGSKNLAELGLLNGFEEELQSFKEIKIDPSRLGSAPALAGRATPKKLRN